MRASALPFSPPYVRVRTGLAEGDAHKDSLCLLRGLRGGSWAESQGWGCPVRVRAPPRTLLSSQCSTSMHPASPHRQPFHDLRFGGEDFVPAVHPTIGGPIFLC